MRAKDDKFAIFLGTFCLVLALTAVPGGKLLAQQSDSEDRSASDMEEIVVTGTLRESLQRSLEVKRSNTVISDALVGAEIGDLPDLSVAETLERITGVTSDRFKGGASELSVRGLGAFLGMSTMNGREISSGSDGRDVNFGQFPSELIGGTIVYKSQQASFVEGGISGIIELSSRRPLEVDGRRFSVKALAGQSDYEERVADGDPISERVTALYTDQFDTGIGAIGIALGGQIRRDTAPEDIYTSSSTYRPCNTIEGVDRSNNCAYLVDDVTGAPTGASDTYFVSNQYIYRAMQTDADRDALMTNLQWQPNEYWDLNLDLQYSQRDDTELRHNLVVADGRRDINPLDISQTGALLHWSGETRLENQSVWRFRGEEYQGAGFNVAWQNERVKVTADVGYSKTERRQDEMDMRIRTNSRVLFELDARGVTVPNLTLTDVSAVENNTGLTFDLDNHDLYTNGARARRRLENVDDEILSFRLDSEFTVDFGAVSSIQAGIRYSDRNRIRDDGIDSTLALVDGGYASAGAVAARRDGFVVEDLFEGADTAMDGITWATWNPEALFVALTGDRNAGLPTGSTLSPDDTDVTEESIAVYGQLNFEGTLFGKPAFGNAGIRVVQTDVTSLGVSTALETIPGADPGTFEVVPVGEPVVNTESNDYTNVLPSFNLGLELTDEILLRFALYGAIARPDLEAMSAALDFDDSADLDSIGSIVSASGNPFLEPLESNNFDVSFEWYFSDDTAFSTAVYYKRLETGVTDSQEEITLIVDGTPTPVTIGRIANSSDSSDLTGVEVTLNHVFSNLPGAWAGLGFSAGYNYADSDFEFPDPTVPDGTNALADFVAPANIPGYSENTGNFALFWEDRRTSLRMAYRARSMYFKPFRTSANRYTKAQDFLDFSARFRLTDKIAVRLQALNILDEPNVFYRPTTDSLAQADYSGRRLFLGLDARF